MFESWVSLAQGNPLLLNILAMLFDKPTAGVSTLMVWTQQTIKNKDASSFRREN